MGMHVAIVMDGNGRWAEARGLPRIAGHERGVQAVKSTVQACIAQGVSILTLFAFSCENWQRPVQEVNFLMNLFFVTLQSHLDELIQQGVSLRFIGDRSAFSEEMQRLMKDAEARSINNDRLMLNLAMNYSGRWDVFQACKRMVEDLAQQQLPSSTINEQLFTQYLSVGDLPDPDLFIRTSGEQRISNFMLFQLAYTELYFTPVSWPDFTPAVFEEALHAYALRDRRYGGVSARYDVPVGIANKELENA
ncbi:MAG: polyprenyl diphosphate synthase [Gammaproteobacteria bacterium]